MNKAWTKERNGEKRGRDSCLWRGTLTGWMWSGVQFCMEMWITRRLARLTARAPAGCRIIVSSKKVPFVPSSSMYSYVPPTHKSIRSRERSVFGRHNASTSIILDDRRLISYCWGKRSPGIYNFKRDIASRKSPNFPKWASLSALAHKRTSDISITNVNSNAIRPLIM